MEKQLPPLMKKHHVPGVAFALISDRQLVWSRGYGVRCAGTDHLAEPDTIMEACSMSKPFFAYMLLRSVEREKLELARPLVDYLGTDYLTDDARHRLITAKMVLSHTSGLPNWRRGGWRSGGPLSLGFEPGAKFRYSGEGFLMLQRAVEKKLETDLDTFSLEELIKPLELKNTRYVWQDAFVVRSSCGHDRDGKVKNGRDYYNHANAAYSLYTSAEDYARFIVEILKDDRSAAHSISKATRTEMLSAISQREDASADWGLGWGLRKLNTQRQVYHSGSNGSGFRCYSEFFPATGDGLVIMTNSLSGADLWKAVVNEWHAGTE